MFKVKPIAIVPPKGAESFPQLTNELLASVSAKFSRSNEGLDAILAKVDLNDPEASVARILKFVDYGHASIGGLTGSITMAIEDVTMWMAYKLFEMAPHADGQESSTRYIKLDESGLPDWKELGLNDEDAAAVDAVAREGLQHYHKEYARLDALATEHPELIKYPDGANDKVKARIRQNYALDRARYFLPFALKTNVILTQTARAWCDTVSKIASLPQKEAQDLAVALTQNLAVFAPNLSRHARVKNGMKINGEAADLCAHANSVDRLANMPAKVYIPNALALPYGLDELRDRENRYDACSPEIAFATVDMQIDNIAIAELRDLNRHRTGFRQSNLEQKGFYLPDEINWDSYEEFFAKVANAHSMLQWKSGHVYSLFLGSQTNFRHVMQLDKFVYEAELRTGPGAHYRYAQHLRDAVKALEAHRIDVSPINLGQGEPE